MEDINLKGIYTDLVRELVARGIKMHVVFPRERRAGLPTELIAENNLKLLKVKTGNITKTNIIEKGITTLTIEQQFLKAVKKNLKNVHFDLIMYSTPPITFTKVIAYFKRKHHCKTYLLLKDIFPQNAVDIDLLKNGGLFWKYFRNKERKLYEISDMIGCMSEGNVQYLLEHNSFLHKKKVEVFPNSIEPAEIKIHSDRSFREKYNIPIGATLFVYGGNLGKPQGIDFLIKITDEFHQVRNGYLFIVGSGTEYEKIKQHLNHLRLTNVALYHILPKDEYDQLLGVADVGLIFLDQRFTIPNFPSRLTSYMEYSLPILAATDKYTDVKDMLQQSESGLWSESGDIEAFLENASLFSTNDTLRKQMGENGRKYLEEHYDIKKTVNVILKHL